MGNINKSIYGVILGVALSSHAFATDWQAKLYTLQDFVLPYEIYKPVVKQKVPLIIHLHGSGEAGTDNKAQLYLGKNIGPDYFSSDAIQKIQKAYVLAPQTPKNIRWANTTLAPYDFKNTPSTKSMSALLNLIDQLIKQNPMIDPNRIYMTGLSRGGQGVWNAALQRPDFFAAIVPIAGSASVKDVGIINALPIWAFHGDADEVTKVEYTRELIDALIRSGGSTNTIRYTEVQDGTHESSWKTAFQNEQLYHWMITHKKAL
ncbi:MAG: prolyl oligopeptidase family serine peptidase [Psychromonas sp.]